MGKTDDFMEELLKETKNNSETKERPKTSDNLVYYKGFDKDLKCRGFQFEIGKTFVEQDRISLCYKGFHYCSKISDVHKFYPLTITGISSTNRVCIVEPLGDTLTGFDKHCSSVIKIVRELSEKEILEVYQEEQRNIEDNDVFCIDIIRELQKQFILTIGGSCALYLQGIYLDRDKDKVDFDIIMPYYQNILAFKKNNIVKEIEEFDSKSSGNDFDKTYCLSTHDGRFLKLDVKVNPYATYETIEYKSHFYNVASHYDIISAKCKYAKQGDDKHKKDLKRIFNN